MQRTFCNGFVGTVGVTNGIQVFLGGKNLSQKLNLAQSMMSMFLNQDYHYSGTNYMNYELSEKFKLVGMSYIHLI